jgi:hypothetical protein
MFREIQNPKEPLHLFIIGGGDTSRIFILMLLIHGLFFFYNKYSQLNPSKKKTLFMAYIGKTKINIDGITIPFEYFYSS